MSFAWAPDDVNGGHDAYLVDTLTENFMRMASGTDGDTIVVEPGGRGSFDGYVAVLRGSSTDLEPANPSVNRRSHVYVASKAVRRRCGSIATGARWDQPVYDGTLLFCCCAQHLATSAYVCQGHV